MEDKLMIVAHPDDDVLWGGANLFSERGWYVLCATNYNIYNTSNTNQSNSRSWDFYKTMSEVGVLSHKICNVKDVYSNDYNDIKNNYENSEFKKELIKLKKRKWKLVLTHNDVGEYGHTGHIAVNKLVNRYFENVKTFQCEKRLSKFLLDKKLDALKWYKRDQTIAKLAHNRNFSNMKPIEKNHILNEKVYLKYNKKSWESIPKVIHQIWFGKTPEPWRKKLMNNVKKIAKENGYEYRLWTNDDLNKIHFPLSWKYILKSLSYGSSRWAQVADLARYEILYRIGGIYCDSLFQIKPVLLKHIKGSFIVANEDPCGLDCKGYKGNPYMSNAFIAVCPLHKSMQYLTHNEYYDNINFNDKRINRQTGPYALAKAINVSSSKPTVFPYNKIYPVWVNNTEHRSSEPNKCIVKNKLKIPCNKYPKSWAIYQHGLGGTWSW